MSMRTLIAAARGVLAVTVAFCIATVTMPSFGAKPYDAEVEYLESPLDASNKNNPYINTGLYPGDDMGAHIRFMPLRTTDSTLCGVQTTSNNKWYFGGSAGSKGQFYLSWLTTPANSDRPALAIGSIYEVFFNYMNDRDRRVVNPSDSSVVKSLPITSSWTQGNGAIRTIWLYHFNNAGARPTSYYGNYRIYSATFTQGNKVVMDLIPVRKGGVGYLYDKVNGLLLGREADSGGPEFTYGGDVTGVDITDQARSIEGTYTLESDEDWTADGIVKIDTSAVINLNGHKLTIAGTYGDGTITNSSETDGELHFAVAARADNISSIALTGNLKVVKEGAGRLTLNRTGQTFTGGVVVAEGTANASEAETGRCWGPDGGTITVDTNGVFCLNGKNGMQNKNFILNGGAISNATSFAADNGLGNVTLIADSRIFTARSTRLRLVAPTGEEKINLGGYTLAVSTEYSGYVELHTPVENGTMVFDILTSGGGGGYLQVPSGEAGGSPTVNLEMGTTAFNSPGTLSVSNYVARYTGGYNHGNGIIKVYGTFTPAAVLANGTERFHGCEMQDGSTIDLSAKSGAWSNVATGWSGTGDADGNRTITFANDATVTIDVHGREIAKGERIVVWDALPSNLTTLTFRCDDGTTPLLATSDGIYYNVTRDEVAVAHWTGAANDDDITNPDNWACTNYIGGEVAGGLPLAATAVRVTGEVGFQITAENPLAYDSITFSNVVLTNDCDWSGLADWAIAANSGDTVNLGSIDLNGHVLTLATRATASNGHVYDFITLSVTDNSEGDPGELHISVPDAGTYLECSGFALSGNLKFVKGGPGWLAMTRANQTFTGGVVIAEGTGYSLYSTHPESTLCWGPDGGRIMVVTNATFDARGNNDFYTKHFILNGGTLANTQYGMNVSAGKYGFGNVTLIADSRFHMAKEVTFTNPCDPAAKIDLGGHTLTLELVNKSGTNAWFPLPIENGTVSAVNGGYFAVPVNTEGGAPSFNLEMSGAAFKLNGGLTVSNYVARYTDGYNHGSAAIKVYGTFTPAAVRANGDAFHGCEMQDGSFIDLSVKSAGWSNVALGWPVTSDADGNRTITFANGATVGILLGGRNVKSEEKIIDWSAAEPENRAGLTFYGVFADGRRTNLKIKDDGLYAPKKGLTIIFR